MTKIQKNEVTKMKRTGQKKPPVNPVHLVLVDHKTRENSDS